MRLHLHRVIFAGLALTGYTVHGQMHKVAKPEQVVRAVGVYEWTGDMTKPAASRLIPVSIFIDGKLEDAGVYVARPVPFALLSGNVYELQNAGISKGTLDLAYARHLQPENAAGDLAYDDGWFGYGSVKPPAVAKSPTKLKPSKTLPVVTSSKGSGGAHPQLQNKTSDDSSATASGQNKSTSSASSTEDSDRPTMKRRSDSPGSADSKTAGSPDASSGSSTAEAASGKGTGGTTSDDPDRPTMKRRTSDSASSNTTDTASTGTSADDPDRPTLKRHTAEDTKKAKSGANDVGMVSGGAALNDDPDRPNLHRGKPVSAMTETELPKLVGLPADIHQMIAVSDAVNRDPHEFALAFDDATERAAVLQKLEALARAQLTAYEKPAKAIVAAPASSATKKTSAARSRRAIVPTPAPEALLDEELKAYTLSYGGAATYVYSAHTAGTGAALRYVTIVAQADGLGDLKPAIQSVTDEAHLDQTPRMRFVDVVDAEASNRASLLFELRGQGERQFGLYRVIAARSEQIFLTGTTQ